MQRLASSTSLRPCAPGCKPGALTPRAPQRPALPQLRRDLLARVSKREHEAFKWQCQGQAASSRGQDKGAALLFARVQDSRAQRRGVKARPPGELLSVLL